MDSDVTRPAFPRRAKASAERRRSVLEAANLCFSRSGFKKTSVDQIAQAAGVSKGLVFVFFETKEALFEAVVAKTQAEWRRFSEEAAASHSDDPVEELRALFTGSFDFLQRHPMLHMLLGLSQHGQALGSTSEVTQANQAFEERLEQVLHKGIKAGSLRSDFDVPRAAEIIHELQSALVVRQLDSAQGKRPFDLRIVEDAINLLLEGLRQR